MWFHNRKSKTFWNSQLSQNGNAITSGSGQNLIITFWMNINLVVIFISNISDIENLCWIFLLNYFSIYFSVVMLKLKPIHSITTCYNLDLTLTLQCGWELRSEPIIHSNLEYVLVKNFCPNKSDNKFMNYRQQTTIFHWNQNETKSHFGGPVVHRQKCPPNMGRMGCVS